MRVGMPGRKRCGHQPANRLAGRPVFRTKVQLIEDGPTLALEQRLIHSGGRVPQDAVQGRDELVERARIVDRKVGRLVPRRHRVRPHPEPVETIHEGPAVVPRFRDDVLREMGKPCLRRSFVAATGAHQEHGCRRSKVGGALEDDPQTARQLETP